MYSVLPAIVSTLFLGYGFYALARQGLTRISGSFSLLCITTFFWQATWAVLFQTSDPVFALFLVKFGYFFILFLPSSLYHFLIEISGQQEERRYVYLSYALALVLAGFLLLSDLFVAGHYQYFWGFYPKAGLLHPVHLLQTFVVVSRGLYVTYNVQKHATESMQIRLRLCFSGLLIFLFAAIDYLCNYGFEFYPPGLIFVAISLGFLTIAIVKYDLLNLMAFAAKLADEITTPLAIIRMQASGIAESLPVLIEGYQMAVKHGLMKPSLQVQKVENLTNISQGIKHQVDRSYMVINLMLASSAMERHDAIPFERYTIGECVTEAIARYPFEPSMKERVKATIENDFEFYGSDTLLVSVLFNLLKNGIYALKSSNKGEIRISAKTIQGRNLLIVTDTGSGISKEVLPHIFKTYYSTKHNKDGSGIGLAFCKKVMTAFKGSIKCESVEGEYTTFSLEFPVA